MNSNEDAIISNTFVRRATLSDAFGIHQAHMKSITEICSKDYDEEQIEAWGNRPYNEESRIEAIKNDYVWVVESNKRIEGYAYLKIFDEHNYGEIWGLYLTPIVCGKGFGRIIIELIIKEARKLKLKKIYLSSTKTSKKFYEAAGFKQVGEDDVTLIRGFEIEGHPMEISL